MQLAEQLRIMPFVRVLLPLAAGILMARLVAAPVWLVSVMVTGIYLAAWLLRRNPAGWAYLIAAVWGTGLLLGMLTIPYEKMPRGERLLMAVEVRETPVTQGRWQRTTAKVGYFRDVGGGAWRACDEKIQLYVDTCYAIRAGEQFSVRGYLNLIDTTGSGYGRLMRARGMTVRTYVSPGGLIARVEQPRRNPAYFATQAQQWAVERLSRLRLSDADRNMAVTLVAGERRGLDPKLRNDYARVGVTHILSVSGLHMGFVLVLVNLLTGWVVLMRRGHLIRNGVVILGMWAYAVIAGLDPPVVRSAFMMSAAQLAFGFSARGNRYNILLGAATVMLAINPNYLFDVSFQLSFLAIGSILFLYPRLYRKKLSRNRWVDTLWSSVLLGVAAQVGTLPLVAYSFGTIPLVSLFVNPVVVLCSFLVVTAGFIWLILPLGFLNPVVSGVVTGALWVQNGAIRWSAALPFAAIDGIQVSGWTVTGIYAILILSTIAWKLREEARTERTQPAAWQKLGFQEKTRIFVE